MALDIWESRRLQMVGATIMIYFIVMDISLYFRLQSYSRPLHATTESPSEEYHLEPISQIAMKTLLLDPPNHYIHVPLAVLFNEVTNFSNVFYFITPNMISVSHVFVALCGMTMLWSDRLSVRQLGVLLFEVRSFLDALDGAVARSRGHHNMIHLDIGSSGFFVDGICDTLGSVALYVGILVYLTTSAPSLNLRSFRGYNLVPSVILPISHKPKVSKKIIAVGGSVTSSRNASSNYRRRVMAVIICSALQMIIGSLFWNRTLDTYHSLLESDIMTAHQKELQIQVFQSKVLWVIIWCWRLCNPHALLEMILIAIFIDRLWEFLKWAQYYGFLVIFMVTAVTHAHLHYVTSLLAYGFYDVK